MAAMFNNTLCKKQKNAAGFTILELLMVVAILSTIAYVTFPLLENNTDQVRFDDTRNRLETIRRAIIGDSSRTVNGGPEIRGYVADTGSLPQNIQALMEKDYCTDPQYRTKAACPTSAWVKQGGVCLADFTLSEGSCPVGRWTDKYTYVSEVGLWVGWNGPYLKSSTVVPPTSTAGKKYPAYADGWGNVKDPGSGAVAADSGWRFSIYTDTDPTTTAPLKPEEHLLVQSLGRDGAASTGPVFDADYPEVNYPDVSVSGSPDYYSAGSTFPTPPQRFISSNEYRVKVAEDNSLPSAKASFDITVTFNVKTAGSSKDLCARLIYKENASLNVVNQPSSSPSSSLDLGTTGIKTVTFKLEGPQNPFYLPMGNYALGIYEYDSSPPGSCTDTKLEVKTYTTMPGIPFITAYDWKIEIP